MAAKMRRDRSSSTGRGAMRRLEAKGTTIAYARTGAGPPIVPMHGADADHSIVARLSAQPDNHRTVIAYDRRDSGNTGKPGQLHADAGARGSRGPLASVRPPIADLPKKSGAPAAILQGVGYVD